jgi:hypothetical protein
MRTLLALGLLWLSCGAAAAGPWRAARAQRRRDAHLRRLLAGSLVPAPRPAADELPVRRPSSL